MTLVVTSLESAKLFLIVTQMFWFLKLIETKKKTH